MARHQTVLVPLMRVLVFALHPAGTYPRTTKEKPRRSRPGIFGLRSNDVFSWPPESAGVTLNNQVYAAFSSGFYVHLTFRVTRMAQHWHVSRAYRAVNYTASHVACESC